MAIGAYEDDCHNTPKRLPFGFEDFNIPSMKEVSGEKSVSSMTWVNLDDGESTHEAEMLDKIKIMEEQVDEIVDEPSSAENTIVNVDFVEVEVDLTVNTPPAELYDENTKVNSKRPVDVTNFSEMRAETSRLEAELAEVKNELLKKEELIDTQKLATTGVVAEDREESDGLAYQFFFREAKSVSLSPSSLTKLSGHFLWPRHRSSNITV